MSLFIRKDIFIYLLWLSVVYIYFHFFIVLWMILFFLNCKHAEGKQTLYPVLLIYIFMDTSYVYILLCFCLCALFVGPFIFCLLASMLCLTSYILWNFLAWCEGLFFVQKFKFHPFIYICLLSFRMTKFTNAITTSLNVFNIELPTFLGIDIFTICFIDVCLSTNEDIMRFVVISVKRCLSLLYIIKIIFRFYMTWRYL